MEIAIILEGYTEAAFVRQTLSPYLGEKGIYMHPILIGTPGHKGGWVSMERAARDIQKLLRQRPDWIVTTYFDYYGIDSGWPGKAEINAAIGNGRRYTTLEKSNTMIAETRVELQTRFPDLNTQNRVMPYFAMHEFEAMLFSDSSILAQVTGVPQSELDLIAMAYPNPEDINDSHETAPSKRIMALKDGYKKVIMGNAAANQIGVERMRSRCPIFNSWMTWLETLGH